ncbi:MAG: UDP-N-acetylmuramoyl-tripeptide--D-alanyl-D-alanine ligase [bacterium]
MLLSKQFVSKALLDAVWYVIHDQKIKKISHLPQWFNDQEITVSIDSRTIKPGQLYWALKGEHFDGHDFVQHAIKAGARAVVVQDLTILQACVWEIDQPVMVVLVSDTYKALVNIAKAWRKELKIPVVGITGSVGKTSTKEMLASILKHAGINAFTSFKNQNNTIGLPLNILNVEKHHEVAVFELGISTKGEMAVLVDILCPDIALITCIAHAHGQGLGTLPEIAEEKRRIFKNFTESNVGVIFGDQGLLSDVAYAHPVARFGFKIKNQVHARKVCLFSDDEGNLTLHFTLRWYDKKVAMSLPGHHKGLICNALAASTLAYLLKIRLEDVVQGLKTYAGVENRFEIKPLKGLQGRIISDCYNANPESMKAALAAFDLMKAPGEKIAVLGDMLELGAHEVYWHRQIGRALNRFPSIKNIVLVGQRAQNIASTAPAGVTILLADDYKEAGKVLKSLLDKKDSLVLVKASHGMNLSEMVQDFVG